MGVEDGYASCVATGAGDAPVEPPPAAGLADALAPPAPPPPLAGEPVAEADAAGAGADAEALAEAGKDDDDGDAATDGVSAAVALPV